LLACFFINYDIMAIYPVVVKVVVVVFVAVAVVVVVYTVCTIFIRNR